jgi:hypothetical protein
MSRERAKTFADRLPPLVPRDEVDISHLSDDLADILYPGRRPRPFRMAVVFDDFDGPEGTRAVQLARKSPVYHETMTGAARRHSASFETRGAGLLRDLFTLVGQRPGTDVLLDGKPVPYARELWLPLFWIFVGGAGAEA